MKKQILGILYCVCMALVLLPVLTVRVETVTPASGTWGTCDWTIDADGIVTVSPTDGIRGKLKQETPWSASYNAQIKKVIFESGVVLPQDCDSMFEGSSKDMYANLTEIDFSRADTSEVTSMNRMFFGCNALTTVNFANFNTSQVTDMCNLFKYCRALTSVDLSSFDTSHVKNISGLFDGCSSLVSIDVSHFNTVSATDMSDMFSGCDLLTEIDVTSFNTSQVTNMIDMFNGCVRLTRLDLSNFDTSNVKTYDDMLSDCTSLKTITVSDEFTIAPDLPGAYTSDADDVLHTTIVPNTAATYSKNTSYIAIGTHGECSWTLAADGLLTVFPTNGICGKLERGTPWGASYNAQIKKVIFESGVVLPQDCDSMFESSTRYKYTNLTEIDFSHADSSEVTSMSSMFSGCTALTVLNLKDFDTSQVTDMCNLFEDCSSLTSVDISSFDTSKVENISGLFDGCSALTSVNVSHFNTTSVTDMSDMFSRCKRLTEIDVTSFDTSNVSNMIDMFDGCIRLTKLDLSNFDTTNVVKFDDMLLDCISIETITVSDKFTIAPELPGTYTSTADNIPHTTIVPNTAATYSVGLPGNVNADDTVDVRDAILLSELVNDPAVVLPLALDYDGSGAVDAADAAYLFGYAVLPLLYPLFP